MPHRYVKHPRYVGKSLAIQRGRRTKTVSDFEILEGREWEKFVAQGLLMPDPNDVPVEPTKAAPKAPEPKQAQEEQVEPEPKKDKPKKLKRSQLVTEKKEEEAKEEPQEEMITKSPFTKGSKKRKKAKKQEE